MVFAELYDAFTVMLETMQTDHDKNIRDKANLCYKNKYDFEFIINLIAESLLGDTLSQYKELQKMNADIMKNCNQVNVKVWDV